MNPVAVLLRGHEKGILSHCPRKLILLVAQTMGKILVVKNRLLPLTVQTGKDHHSAGKIGDESTQLLRTVALRFF